MLMFPKTSIQSFVYDLIDVFMFPDDVVKEIYRKKWNSKLFFVSKSDRYRYTSLFFIFICKLLCSSNKKTARYIIFEVLTKSKVWIDLIYLTIFGNNLMFKTRV